MASGQMTGRSVEADVSNRQVTATGSTTARAIKDRFSDVVNVKDFGATCDGATDDTGAMQTMLASLGTMPRTIVIDGPCVVNSHLFIPAIQPVRTEGNGAFVGTGIVTYTPTQGQGPVRRRALTGKLAWDYSTRATYALLGTATGKAITADSAKGAQKVSFTATAASTYAGIGVSGTWDFSTSDRFALDMGFDKAEVDSYVVVFLCFDVAGYANYALLPGWAEDIVKPLRGVASVSKASATITGVANWSAVRRIEVRFYRRAETTNVASAVYLYGFWSHVTARPKVLLTFDDATASLITGIAPIMAAAGMRGTAYAIGSTLDNGTAGATVAQMQALYAAGWDIGNHTWDHLRLTRAIASYTRAATTATMVFTLDHGYIPGDQITIAGYDSDEWNGARTVATVPDTKTITFATAGVEPITTALGYGYIAEDQGWVRSELQRNRDWLLSRGWARGANHVAYPFGGWDMSMFSTMSGIGVLTGRTTQALSVGLWTHETPGGVPSPEPYVLSAYELKDTTTAVQALAKVDDAITKGGTVVLFGHGIKASSPGATEMLTSEFQAFIDGIKTRRDAGTVDVVTVSEWYDRL